MAFGKTQCPHVPHLKVREAVPQSQGSQLVSCHRSLPLRSQCQPDSCDITAGQCHAGTHSGITCTQRDRSSSKKKAVSFHLG